MALAGPQKDAFEVVRGGIHDVDDVFARLSRDIERIVRTAPEPLDSASIMRQIDRRLDRAFGLTQQSALTSDLYGTIVRSGEAAAARPYLRLLRRVETTVVARDPALWQQIRPRLLGDLGLGPRVALLPDLDPTVPENYRQMVQFMRQQFAETRIERARSFDPQRRWVPRERWTTKRGYRLSDRVWQQGRVVRRNITMTLKDGIRRGDGPVTLAKRLEHYLNPEAAPLRFFEDGRIVLRNMTNKPTYGGWGSTHARRLARTELMRINGAATIEAARHIPGVLGIRWRVSGSHPEPDECDENARRSSRGLPPGVYTFDEVPRYPNHPNDLCVLMHEMMPANDVVDLLVKQYGGV